MTPFRLGSLVKFFSLAVFALLLAQSAAAQPIVCSASAGVPPLMRAEGHTELAGDLLVTCTGGLPTQAGLPVPQINISLSANTNITSKVLSTQLGTFTGGIPAALNEALLIIDEPNSPNSLGIQCAQGGAYYNPGNNSICAGQPGGWDPGVVGGTFNLPAQPYPILNCGAVVEGIPAAPDGGPSGPGVCQIIATPFPEHTYDGTLAGTLCGAGLAGGCEGEPPQVGDFGLCGMSSVSPGTVGAPGYACGRPNVFQGRVGTAQSPTQYNAVTFYGVPFDPPGSKFSRTLRFTNIRVDATLLAPSTTFTPTQVTLSISINGSTSLGISNPQQIVGYVNIGLDPVDPSGLSTASSSVRFSEGFASSWKDKNISFTVGDNNDDQGNATFGSGNTYLYNGNTNYPFDVAQNVPGAVYSTESGFQWQDNFQHAPPVPNPPPGFTFGVNQLPMGTVPNQGYPFSSDQNSGQDTGIVNAGVASSGSRMALTFANVPHGVSVVVPITVYLYRQGCTLQCLATGVAVLTQSDAAGAGSFNPIVGTTTAIVTGGLAVYEILYADPLSTEYADVKVQLSNGQTLPAAGVTVTGGFAPYYNGGGLGPSEPTPNTQFAAPTALPRFNFAGTIITSTPSAASVLIAGTGCNPGTYSTPVNLVWNPQSSCTVSFSTPQIIGGSRYTFSSASVNGGTAATTNPLPIVPGYPTNINATFSASLSIVSISGACPVPTGAPNSPYYVSPINVFGGNGIYQLTLTGPSWLALTVSAGTGGSNGFVTALTGTPPSAGTYPFSVVARDTAGSTPGVYNCTIVVNAPAAPPPAITSGCPASAPIGANFSFALSATGGNGQFTWTIVSGRLPPGLTLSGNVITGIPTGSPGSNSFTIQVTSGGLTTTLTCSITTSLPPLQLTSACPANGMQGSAFNPFTFGATGGLGSGTYTFSIQGTLPPGITQSGNTISGTPTGSGTFSFTVTVTSGTQTITGPTCSITIAPPPLQVTGGCPAGASLTGILVSLSASASGGSPPYTFTLSGPPWLTLSSSGSSASVSGTPPPTATGSFTVTITVSDSAQSTPTTFKCTLNVNRAPLQVSGTCPTGSVTAGSSIAIPVTPAGGLPPYTVTASGITGSTQNGTGVTGTAPATPGTYNILVTVTDSAGSSPATVSCSLIVTAPPIKLTATCPAGSLSLPVSVSIPLSAAGGQPPYQWTLSGPPWLSLSNATGATTTLVSSGTPTTSGPFSFSITLTDSANLNMSLPCSSSIAAPPPPNITITGPSSPGTSLQTVPVSLQTPAPTLLPLTGTLQISFVPNAFGITDNPQVYFDGGSRTVSFTEQVGQTSISLPNIQPGTDAGTIRVELISVLQGGVDVTPSPHVFFQLVVPRSPPTITSVTFQNESATGFDVAISGFSPPRDLETVQLTFTPATGESLNGAVSFSVDVTSVFVQYYSSSASQSAGSMWQNLLIPVSVSGNKASIGSVTVVVTNSAGSSQTVTATR